MTASDDFCLSNFSIFFIEQQKLIDVFANSGIIININSQAKQQHIWKQLQNAYNFSRKHWESVHCNGNTLLYENCFVQNSVYFCQAFRRSTKLV